MHCSWTGCYTPLYIFGGSLVCGSCAGSTSSCPLRHPALHCTVCGGLWRAHTRCVTLHCTMWVTMWDMQSCGSAQCSIILRLHQVLASCIFFFCSPLPVLLEIYGSEGLCGEGQESDGVFLGREAWMSTNRWTSAFYSWVPGWGTLWIPAGGWMWTLERLHLELLASCVFFSVSLISVVPTCYNLSPWQW